MPVRPLSLGRRGRMWDDPRLEWRRLSASSSGTFLLVLAGARWRGRGRGERTGPSAEPRASPTRLMVLA